MPAHNLRDKAATRLMMIRVWVYLCLAGYCAGTAPSVIIRTMFFRRIINQLLVCLLVIGLLNNSASALNHACSVSADGEHSILEFAPSFDCSQDDCVPTAEDVVTPGFKAGTDGFGSCPDACSPPHWRSKRSRVLNAKLVLPPPAVDQAVATLSLVNSWVLSGQFPSPPSPRIPDAIRFQRTVVLLI